MRELIEILRQNPILIFLLATWLLGGIGKVLQRSREARNRQAPGLPTDASAPSESAPRRPTPEEVAREMRRALGLDPEPERPAPPERASQPEPRQTFEHDFDDEAPVEAPRKPVPVVRKPAPPPLPRRSVVRPEAPPTPLRPRELGRVSVHVAPKVGNEMQQRKAPATGAVGAHALGTLGGRDPQRRNRPRREGSTLVDLHDLPRAVVLREIFDLPLSLREPRG